jgi:hypothetical protein
MTALLRDVQLDDLSLDDRVALRDLRDALLELRARGGTGDSKSGRRIGRLGRHGRAADR